MDSHTVKDFLYTIGWKDPNVTDRLLELLTKFINFLDEEPVRVEKLQYSLKDLLEYLCTEEGNTNSNCKAVDYLLTHKYYDKITEIKLPADLKSIVEDLRDNLHDTHTNRDIAIMLQSAPEQLLERLERIMGDEGRSPK